jgi:UDP-GlcNAc:undecaprenyl-phosphate GlcNAc-1-phosphate transferase
MYCGLVAGLLVADRLSYLQQAFLPGGRTVLGLLLAGGLLVLVGIVDDRWGLGALPKLAGQIAAGGIVVWSGAYLPWIPGPGGETISLEPDLSYTVTILLIVATINAVNFIDGLDGLAAGIVGISAAAYLIYSYTLANSVGIPSQSVPAVASAVLAGMCLGFLPHNFNPARIFMGDTGSMLLGLLLAYGPISSAASLDQNILTDFSGGAHPVNRFPTILPLIIPVAVWIIPYTDMLLAVIRRTMKGMSPFDADRQHLHHRLLNMGHSHRSSVLLMYLWAALFSSLVVGLSVVRISLIWFALITLAAIGGLSLATAPKLRPWHGGGKRERGRASRPRSGDALPPAPDLAAPVGGPGPGLPPGARYDRSSFPPAGPGVIQNGDGHDTAGWNRADWNGPDGRGAVGWNPADWNGSDWNGTTNGSNGGATGNSRVTWNDRANGNGHGTPARRNPEGRTPAGGTPAGGPPAGGTASGNGTADWFGGAGGFGGTGWTGGLNGNYGPGGNGGASRDGNANANGDASRATGRGHPSSGNVQGGGGGRHSRPPGTNPGGPAAPSSRGPRWPRTSR